MGFFFRYLVLIIGLVFGSYAQSQTCCSAGTALANSYALNQGSKGTGLVILALEHNSVNRLVDGNRILKNDPRTRNAQRILLRSDFSLNKRISFSMTLPILKQFRSNIAETEVTSGLSDAQFWVQTQIFKKDDHNLNIGLAIEMPTGRINFRDSRGVILSPDMQSGSGTWDQLIRIGYNREHLITNLLAMLSFSYRRNGTNSKFAKSESSNGRSFKFGNEWITELLFQRPFTYAKLFLTPSIGINIRKSEANIEQGFIASNSGGTWINIPVSMYVTTADEWGVSTYFIYPAYQQISGLQISSSFTLGVQGTYKFNTINKSKKR